MKTNAEHGQKGDTLKMGKNSKQRGRKTEVRRRRGRRSGRRRIECVLIEKRQRADAKAKRRDMSEFIKNNSRVNSQTPGHASTTKHYIKKQNNPHLSLSLFVSHTHTQTLVLRFRRQNLGFLHRCPLICWRETWGRGLGSETDTYLLLLPSGAELWVRVCM